MKTDLKDVLHHYLGCDVIISDPMGEDVKGKLVCIDLEGMCQVVVSSKQIELAIIDYVKPVLFHLDDMKGKHQKYLHQFAEGYLDLPFLDSLRVDAVISNFLVN